MSFEKNRKPEVLSPCGSIEALKGAIASGADAVYIGGRKFGARAYAENPERDVLLDAIDFVHLNGKKIYMTVNTLLKEDELEKELYPELLPYYERGLDAVIVQDIGVMDFIRNAFPDLHIHASTQLTVTGSYGAEFLKKHFGISRVVPARE
ncbi:MAG: U32 family peptidase, partial [Lachnospiraceae bacterium]|nr:U32 family peptidase [Lachnospiraceae bacterium]